MLKDIEEFYRKTKLNAVSGSWSGKVPIEYVFTFHKEYLRFPSVKLPKGPISGEYERLLKRRSSTRTFSNKPVPLGILAKILGSCRIIDKDPERRTYPSAGARFPLEIYLIAFRVKGLEPGIYHFNFSKFSLEVLLLSDLKKYETEFVSPFLKNAAGALIFTSVMSRSEVKYGLKAYPYSLLEAGHMSQNILLSCTKHNVGACAVGGFINNKIIELLDLTEDEIPIHVIGFGFKA